MPASRDPGKELRAQQSRRKVIVLIILAGFLLICFGKLLVKKNDREDSEVVAETPSNAQPTPERKASDMRTVVPVNLDYEPRLARVMFESPVQVVPEAETPSPPPPPPTPVIDPEKVCAQALRLLEIQGLIHGETPIAVINGQRIQSGDYIEGYRVARIKENSVVFEKNGVSIQLGF